MMDGVIYPQICCGQSVKTGYIACGGLLVRCISGPSGSTYWACSPQDVEAYATWDMLSDEPNFVDDDEWELVSCDRAKQIISSWE